MIRAASAVTTGSMDYLNNPGFELHAFASMSGFGSPLMCYTNTSGVVMSLTGESGNAKTGAMYAGLSVFGHPKNLSVVDGSIPWPAQLDVWS